MGATRAPGAPTYIRQLHDGLPQSCMHSSDDRGDGVTLFAGARDANRILELPVAPLPDPAGPEALKKPPRGYAAAAMCGVVLAMTTPSGTKPVSTYRQSEIANFRAKAMSMMRRILGD